MRYLWFKAKHYGWGWYPATWQGWAVTTAFVAFMVWNAFRLDAVPHSAPDALRPFIIQMFFTAALLVFVCYLTGEKTQWRWAGVPVAPRTARILTIATIVLIGAAVIGSIAALYFIPPMKNADMLAGAGRYQIVKSDVQYFGSVTGYYVRPDAPGAFPGVVMIHENRGLRPEIRQSAETLAAAGYQVLAVDLLGGVAEDQTGARALTANYSIEAGVVNMRAAAAYLRDHGAAKVASLGWCFGGRQSVELAISGEPLDATVVYYGSGIPTTADRLRPITWPVLGIFGDQDQAIPLETVDAFRSTLDALSVDHEIHVYPGVGHAFANPSGMNYAPEATKDAWEKTLRFLDRTLHE